MTTKLEEIRDELAKEHAMSIRCMKTKVLRKHSYSDGFDAAVQELMPVVDGLLDLNIFLAKCYQNNYETFCSASNVDHRKEITEERKEEFFKFMYAFSSIQGTHQRRLVEKLSKQEQRGQTFKQIEQALAKVGVE